MLASVSALNGFERLETYQHGADLTHGRASKEGVLGSDGIRAWRHVASGVRVVRFCAPGPLVSLTMFVGTKPVNDAGLPHTLEHIIFLGSKRHPQRGFLDTLACRSLGDGTNAFTANEYTCYTAMTAGVEGMLSLLPCFVDHVLRPTKTADRAAFNSEVYHCRADGKEAGVVFSEMQARELTEPDMLDREMRRSLLANTSLANEAGGMCDAIRTLTPQDIHSYHRRFYCGANVSIVIGGSVSIEDSVILNALASVLDEFARSEDFRRGSVAWAKPLELLPLAKPVDKRIVRFPCADDAMGSATVAWRSPGMNNVCHTRAIEVILDYLTTLESSPLQQRFVTTENPDATDVHYEVENYLDVSTVSLTLDGVQHLESDDDDEDDSDTPSSRNGSSGTGASAQPNSLTASPVCSSLGGDAIEEISPLESAVLGTHVVEYLEAMVSGNGLPGGLEAVRAAVDRLLDEFLSDLESDAHSTVPDAVLCELLYDSRSSTRVGEGARGYINSLFLLRQEPEGFWLNLIRQTFVDQPRVEVYMIPDPDLAEHHAAQEKAAREKRLDAMNSTGSIGRGESSNATRPETDAIECGLPLRPSTEHIPRLSYTSSISSDGPYFLQVVTVDSGLVHGSIVFSTSTLSFEQKLCLPLLTELLLSMDLRMDDGSLVSYVENCQALADSSVHTDSSGVWLERFTSVSSSCVGVSYAARSSKFEDATRLLLRAIFHGEVTNRRLSSVAKQAESDVVEGLREPATVKSAAGRILPRLVDHSGRNLSNGEVDSLFGREPLVSFIAEEYSRPKGRPRIRRRLLQLMNSAVVGIREQTSNGIFVQLACRDPNRAKREFESQWADCWHPEEAWAHNENGASCLESKVSGPNAKSGAMTSRDSNTSRQAPIRGGPCVPLHSSLGPGRELCRAIGVPGSDSCYMDIRVDCAVSRQHAQYGRVRVLTEMLSRTEGPLYSAVRGAGFAYSVSLYMGRSQLIISIDEASLPVEAWEAVSQTLAEFRASLADESKFAALERDVETAKSTILFELVANRGTPTSILRGAMNSCAIGVPTGTLADRSLEESIESVDMHGVREGFDEYVASLLRPRSRLAVLTCKPSLVRELTSRFGVCSHPLLFEEMIAEDCTPPAITDAVATLAK